MSRPESKGWIKTHITIEEAKELGLTQIVKQLEIDKALRESLGMRPLQDEIKNPTRLRAGRPKVSTSLRPSKLIRTNFNNLT